MDGYYRGDFSISDGDGELIITLPSRRYVMDYQIEMISNNNIGGLLPLRCLTADGKPRFYYDTAGLETLEAYMQANGQSVRSLAETLMDISVTIGNLNKYLLEEKCLLLKSRLIYIDPLRRGVKLIYLPVELPENRQSSFIGFVLDSVGDFKPEDATGKLFCRRIIEEVKKAGFKYDAFTDFLLDIICFSECDNAGDGAVNISAADRRYAPGPAVTPKNIFQVIKGLIRGVNRQAPAPDRGVKPAAEKFSAAGGVSAAGGFSATGNALSVGTGAAAGERRLLPVLAAAIVAVAYFSANSFIPLDADRGNIYRSAILVIALGAEMLLLLYFIKDKLFIDREKLGKSARRGGFSEAVNAATEVHDANAAEAMGAPPSDLWAASVDENFRENGPPHGKAESPPYDEWPECDMSELIDLSVPSAPPLPDGDSQTEILPCLKELDAVLYIKDAMREYGVTLDKDKFLIGRHKDKADLALDNRAVGKTHAMLTKSGDGWYLKDLNSKNGTYINNIRLENGAQKPLAQSDMITVANVDMVFTAIR